MSDSKSLGPLHWLHSLNGSNRSTKAEPVASGDRGTALVEPDAAPAGQEETIPVRDREHLLERDWPSELESQFGLTAPEVAESTRPVESVESIAALRERLAYYEHFDALIQDNIARSAQLFQAVFAERERARTIQTEAESTVNAVAQEADRRITAERTHVVNILHALMEEATYLHQRSDALIQRLAEALTELSPQADEDDEPVSGA